jgi:hypothetical protein
MTACPHVTPSTPLPRRTVCADCHDLEVEQLRARIAALESSPATMLVVGPPAPAAIRPAAVPRPRVGGAR